MNKKLIAIAVAAGLAPMAAQADVSVYGKINMGLSQADVDTAGTGFSTLAITSHDSRFGIKGSEDLGGGMSAFFKMETAIDMDDKAGATTFSRDKYLGLKGGFGEVKMGYYNSAYKNVFGGMDLFADSIGDVTGTGTHGGLDARNDNAIGYKNSFGPLTLQVDMDFAETDTSGEDDGLAVGVAYKAGGMKISAGIVNHADGEPAGDTADEGTRLGFQMKMGSGKLNVLYESIDADGSDTSKDIDVTTIQYGMNMGKNMFGISYTMVGGDGADNDATQTTIGVHHKLSKKTKVAVAYTAIDNDDNSSASGRIGNTSSGFTKDDISAGDDLSQVGVMITHSF